MLIPERLKYKERIALLAPSSPVPETDALECKQLLERMGFQVELGESCTSRFHGYLAGTDALRANELNCAFCNEQIRGIFCIRGGYGATRLLEHLDYSEIKKHPKVFLGYSDITCLHMAFQQFCDFVTYHGPMPESNMLRRFDMYSSTCFHTVLQLGETTIESGAGNFFYEFKNPTGFPLETIAKGRGEGALCGGNMALFTSLIGTPYFPNIDGKILFFEDIYESVPRVNRMLDQLWHSGVFQVCSGVLFGDFAECENPEEVSFSIKDLFRERFLGFDKPVIAGLMCGHCVPTGTLPIGMHCRIDTDYQSIVFCET